MDRLPWRRPAVPPVNNGIVIADRSRRHRSAAGTVWKRRGIPPRGSQWDRDKFIIRVTFWPRKNARDRTKTNRVATRVHYVPVTCAHRYCAHLHARCPTGHIWCPIGCPVCPIGCPKGHISCPIGYQIVLYMCYMLSCRSCMLSYRSYRLSYR